MTPNRVHAVMAAGVEQPRLLEEWRARPARLRELGVEPEGFDFDALGRFAGLAVKVRHNALRAFLPLSFRLMGAAAIEIEVFAAYALHRSRLGLGYADSTQRRACDLIDFLGAWLEPGRPVHRLLWDAIRHEDGLARLGPWHREPDAAPVSGAGAARIRGEIVLYETRTDLSDLADALSAPTPDLQQVPERPGHVCLWRPPEGGVCASLALDAFGFYLLAAINGRRSSATLSRRLGGGRGMVRAVETALRELAGLGVVALPGMPDSKPTAVRGRRRQRCA